MRQNVDLEKTDHSRLDTFGGWGPWWTSGLENRPRVKPESSILSPSAEDCPRGLRGLIANQEVNASWLTCSNHVSSSLLDAEMQGPGGNGRLTGYGTDGSGDPAWL
jgi:hypothetical protein